jgi:hypothetical protein
LFPIVAEVKLHGADYTIKDGAPPRTPDSPLPRAEFGRKNRAPPRTPDSACFEARRMPPCYFLFGIGILMGLVGPRSLSALTCSIIAR